MEKKSNVFHYNLMCNLRQLMRPYIETYLGERTRKRPSKIRRVSCKGRIKASGVESIS